MSALDCAVLTVSDSRTLKEDTSGDLLETMILGDGHRLADRTLVRDDVYQVRAVVSRWIADRLQRPRLPDDYLTCRGRGAPAGMRPPSAGTRIGRRAV